MEEKFKVGDIVAMYVQGVYEDNGRHYIGLSDGIKHTYRVEAFDYQAEWEEGLLPKQMRVYVRDINIMNSLPYLSQIKHEILKDRYPDLGEEYSFKVIEERVDENTGGVFYILRDIYGLRHRYYPNNDPKRELGDIFSLIVKEIVEKDRNRAFLKFKLPQEAVLPAKQVAVVSIEEEESRFGTENSKLEFKSTIVYPPGGVEPNIDRQLESILKTIAGFQNNEGGILYIGVSDSGNVCGFNDDFQYLNSSNVDSNTYQLNIDGYENKIRSTVRYALGGLSNSAIDFDFAKENDLHFCKITVQPVSNPVFMHGTKLYERAGMMTQLLKGDEITWFIMDRLRKKQTGVFVKESTSAIVTDNENENGQIADTKETEELKIEISSIENDAQLNPWKWMRFYSTGEWSFDNNKDTSSNDLVYQLMIPEEHKNHRLFMVYKDGKINAVNPYNIISPQRANGRRRMRNRNQRYQNGWDTNAEILTMFTAKKDDFFAVKSKTDSHSYLKVHNIEAISLHTSLNSQGNIVVNTRLDQSVRIENVYHIDKRYHANILSLLHRDNETSTKLGIRTNDVYYKGNIATLKKVIDLQEDMGESIERESKKNLILQ